MTSIKEAGLFSKEKYIKHSRGRNIHSIVTKLDTNVNLIKIQCLSENFICETNRSGRTSLERKTRWHSSVRNFATIITKLGTHIGLIKLQFEFEDELYGANRRGRTFLQRKSFETF